jgi:RNA polymerase subunit RPABC4/transcription elongation factor Spt4
MNTVDQNYKFCTRCGTKLSLNSEQCLICGSQEFSFKTPVIDEDIQAAVRLTLAESRNKGYRIMVMILAFVGSLQCSHNIMLAYLLLTE